MSNLLFRGLHTLAQRPAHLIGTLIVVGYLLMALLGGTLAPYDYTQVMEDTTRCTTRSNGSTLCPALKNAPPTAEHIFGTDRNGRDVFSRLLHGAWHTIGLPIIASSLAVFLGAALGLVMGYLGGWTDELLSRAVDSLLSIPVLVLALVALSTIVPSLEMADNALIDALGAVNIALVAVITLLYTPIVARIVRSVTLGLRDRGYVEVAKIRGESTFYILTQEILPGVLPALIVEGSLRFSYSIFLVASLGFLGLGAQPPLSEWGRMVLDARANYATAPWALWVPVIAIATLIIAVNLMSDGLRRVFRYERESL